MNSYDIIIIGGGLSGLSSAVELSARKFKVLLLEQNKHCGGRAYSFIEKKRGECVDNGQHLMMGCYETTRRFLNMIGTDNLTELQPNLKIDFLIDTMRGTTLIFPNLPAPLHTLFGLLRFNAVPFLQRLQTINIAKELFFSSPSKENELDSSSADEWLTKLNQSEILRKYLWDVITVGALNNHPQNVSALMLYRVLRNVFFGKKENASLLIPRVGLSDLFVEPAIKFIESHAGEVRTGVGVRKIVADGKIIRSVETSRGEILNAKFFISAVPWFAYERILSNSYIKPTTDFFRYKPSPIISIHLWFENKITDLDFAALICKRIQWFFNRSILSSTGLKSDSQYLSLVISGAEEFVSLTDEQLVNIAIEDLFQVLKPTQKPKLIHSLVLKERRATFLPSPNLEIHRPDTPTEYENFFLAGDWTATKLPATIEGAVISGKKAADCIK